MVKIWFLFSALLGIGIGTLARHIPYLKYHFFTVGLITVWICLVTPIVILIVRHPRDEKDDKGP